METQINPLHLCPEINVIRCMLNFDKHDKVSHKSKCKSTSFDIRVTSVLVSFATLGLGLLFLTL